MIELLAQPDKMLEFIESNRNSYFIILKTIPNFKEWLEPLPGSTLQEKLRNFCDGNSLRPVCSAEGCAKHTTLKDRSFFRGFQPFCSKKCAQTTASVRQKIVDTHKERFGSGSVRGTRSGQEKYAETWVKNSEANRASVEAAKAKRISTCRERFGVDCVLKHPDILKKAHKNASASMHQYKEFTSLNGNVYAIRGYEGFAIDILEAEGLDFIADDFATPRVAYDMGGKERHYYPDIFIPSLNKIVEVKSTYWLAKQPLKNTSILLGCQAQGFDFEFWVFDGKSKMPLVINNVTSLKEFFQ